MRSLNSIRSKTARLVDRFRSPSPVAGSPPDRSGSLQPPPGGEPHSIGSHAARELVKIDSTAPSDPSATILALTPLTSRSPSPGSPLAVRSLSPPPPAGHPGRGSQFAIVNNNSNVNNNAPGGIIVNNSFVNSFAQVISHDRDAEDMNTIEKGLGQHHVARALHDAQPLTGGCMEGTRVEVLKDTEDLLTSRGGAHIVWIAGMAGTGKTAIALTLSRRLVKLPIVLLGGTFFCSRSAGVIERTDAQRIIPTLATVLARSRLPKYTQALAVELKKDPDLASKEVNVQVECLLLKPLKSVRTRDKLIVLVIDALDECRDQVLLAELVNALADFNATPLNNPGSRERLVELIESLQDFKRTQLDSLARLAEIIGPIVDLKATLREDRAAHPRLEELIDTLADFRPTTLNRRDDQIELSKLIAEVVVIKTMPLSHPDNLAKLMKLIESLAEFRASRLDNQVTLSKLIGALADRKSTAFDSCDDRMELEGLIDVLNDFKATGPSNLFNQAELANLIDELAYFRSTPAVKFLFTSRPEIRIRDSAITDKSLSSIVQLHMVDKNVVTSDIRLYIQRTLEKSSKSLRWYTDRDIDDLAALSAGLFIFASTVLAYVLKRKDGPGRSERLCTVKLQAAESAIATDPLDKMYSLVLMQASDPSAYEPAELDETRRIVAVILSMRSPFTIKALAEFLGVSTEHLRGSLDELHAVIFVPEQDDEGELRALHASFGDYIFTRAAVHIRIAKNLGHDELARACLKRMDADDLCFNISRSQSSHIPNPKARPDWIARSLVYACLNWAHHIDLVSERPSVDRTLASILRVKLLFWLEVLSVLSEISRASEFLRLAAEKVTSPDVSQFLRDADSFVTSSREAIERSAPHIYISAMAFAPKDSLIYQTFSSHLIGIPVIEKFGADGGSSDHSIRFQSVSDAKSPNQPMDGHTGGVHAIAVSHDDHFIASGSADGSAQVWNTQTRQKMYPSLLGHEGPICAVAFSSDSQWIATGSDDMTSRLWKVHTGQFSTVELRGHVGRVTAVAFAPNGLHLVSGSWDMTVRVWDVSTGKPAEISQMRFVQPVSSVAYSPSGAVIAVGSNGGYAWIFEALTGEMLRRFSFPSHLPDPTFLAFSPDGSRLVTTLRTNVNIFDVQTGQHVTNLPGLASENAVTAVAYSPDGQSIACSTSRLSVLLWRPNGKNALELFPSGHAHDITSVTFSSDGRFLITGSWDSTIRILDLQKIRSLTDETDQSRLTALSFAPYEERSWLGPFRDWLVSPSGQLLLWAPPEYRGRLEIGNHSRIIATHRAVLTAVDGLLHQGEDWINCWRSY